MNAIVVIVIGAKYEKIYQSNRMQLEAYAKRCNATLEICRTPPDPEMQCHLLTQKLLIPQQYLQYEWIAFLDLDIAIAQDAPSIFDEIVPGKGFGAVLDPRGQPKFDFINIHWFKHPDPQNLTTQWYFQDQGFALNDKLMGSINGGVWLCQPKLVADLFANYYWAKAKSPDLYPMYEEAPMAYLTQSNDLFFALDEKFNQQLIYLIADQNPSFHTRIAKWQSWINKPLNKMFPARTSQFMLKPYVELVQKSLKENYILHFAGNFPIPKKLDNQIQ